MEKQCLLVVAMDIGTTYSRVALSFRQQFSESPRDVKLLVWPYTWNKAPTVVLFNQDKVFDSFGCEAELRYSDFVEEGQHKQCYFFKRFKFKLDRKMEDEEAVKAVDTLGKTMPAATVLAAVIKALRVRVLDLLEKRATFIDERDILWVFNVPARWTDSSQHLMKTAACEAGIQDDKMRIVLDPAAASVFYKTIDCEEAMTSKYMVLDVGGGTTNITVLKKQRGGDTTAIYHSSTNKESLFDGFWLMLEETLGQETLESLRMDNTMNFFQMERDLENKALGVHDKIIVKAPVDLCLTIKNELLNKCPFLEKKYSLLGSIKVYRDKISLDVCSFKEYLSVRFGKIWSQLNRAFEHQAVAGTSICFITGGLSDSDYFIDSLKQKLPSVRFVTHGNAQFANVIGASMYGHRPEMVSYNISTAVVDDLIAEQRNDSYQALGNKDKKTQNDDSGQFHDTSTARTTKSADKGDVDVTKALDSFICKFKETDVLNEKSLEDLKKQHDKIIDLLNAQFEQTLKRKQNQEKDHQALYQEMQQLKGEIMSKQKQLEEDVLTLTSDRDILKERAVETEKKYKILLTEVTKLKQENQRINKNNQQLSMDNSRAQFQVSRLQNELDALKQDRKSKEKNEEQLRCEIHSLRASAEKRQETIAKLLTENQNLKSRLRESETQYMQAESKVDEKLQILQQMGLAVSQHAEMELSFKQQISKLREENKTLKRERYLLAQNEMITGNEEKERLDNNENAVSSSKDRSDTENADEVPGRTGEICNLSDPNRSARLCERFSDLFHEDWPIAVEYLTKSNLTQKKAVGCLLSLLQVCFNTCKKVSKMQIQILTCALLHPVETLSDSASNAAQSVQLRAEDLTEVGNRSNHALLQLRRAIAAHPSVVQRIKEECAKEVNASFLQEHCLQWTHTTFETCTPFIMKCAELCWLMCLLDPPLEMKFDFKQGEEINPEVYILHSTSGQTSDFLVWPPLYNSETGNIVAQGVAEAFTQ